MQRATTTQQAGPRLDEAFAGYLRDYQQSRTTQAPAQHAPVPRAAPKPRAPGTSRIRKYARALLLAGGIATLFGLGAARENILERIRESPAGPSAPSQTTIPAVPSVKTFAVGNAQVTARTYGRRESGIIYVSVHDSENTAVEAAKRVIDEHGGILVELEYGGGRRISFSLQGTQYEFEPNGMFTDEGIRRSLRMYGSGNYSPAAHAVIRSFAEEFLETYGISRAGAIVALHNNTEEAFSIQSYTADDHRRMNDAAAVSRGSGADQDDFFFVTHPRLFEGLKGGKYGVVLQDNKHCLDDGSLSVLAGQRGIPYVNVEAQHGHQAEQAEMLQLMQPHLQEVLLRPGRSA